MATGYATFLEDSNNVIAPDRILDLSPQNDDDDDFILQAGVSEDKQYTAGCGTVCFADDVRDGCRAFVMRGMSCAGNTRYDEVTTPNSTNGLHESGDVQKKSRFDLTSNVLVMKKPLITGSKWVSGKMKKAFYVAIGKLLKDDEDLTVATEDSLEVQVEPRKDRKNKVAVKEERLGSDDETVGTEQDSLSVNTHMAVWNAVGVYDMLNE